MAKKMRQKIKQKSLSKNEWAFIAKSYLTLAYIGIQELKSKKYFNDKEVSILKSGQWQIYDAQLLLIPIIWNLKHAIELVLKAHYVTFLNGYFKIHDTKNLKDGLAKTLNIQEQDNKFDEFSKIVDKYFHLKFFNGKLIGSSQILDINNDIFRYPEGSKSIFQLDLKTFQKITREEIEELEKDIKLIYLRLAIPAEYKHLKKYWSQWAHS